VPGGTCLEISGEEKEQSTLEKFFSANAKNEKGQEMSFNIEPEKRSETIVRIPTPSGSLGRLVGPSLGEKVDKK
jgi:hypothetical protein